MHEMSLCESIVRIVEKQTGKEAGGKPFGRVVTVRVEIGDVSGASEESLLFCFPFAAKGTRAEGAALEFIRSPGNALRVVEMEVN